MPWVRALRARAHSIAAAVQAGQLGQGVEDLEDVAQLLDQGGRAGGGGLLGFLQELGAQAEGELGLGRLVEGAAVAVGGGQLGDAVADQLHGPSSSRRWHARSAKPSGSAP